ncbi:MAG: hypothetical protein KDA32_06855 [Phycisphaerales bacterium]|nr:hypothetical protein [Phycisphaerales bacterium]
MADDQQAWQFLIPIAQLRIDDNDPINGRWRVADVEFLSREAASTVISRHGDGPPAAVEIRTKFVESAWAFARLTRNGERDNATREAFRDVAEAVNLLAVTRAFWVNRASNTGFAILGYPLVKQRNAWIVQQGGLATFDTASREGGLTPFCLDAHWHGHISGTWRVIELFRALDDSALDPQWRAQIRRAAGLIGRSLMTSERADAFLWNVFALETLLTRPGERNGRRLSDRIAGLLGWYLADNRPGYESELTDLFRIRCDAVHDADYSNLTTEVVLLSDLYAVNTLRNVAVHRARFRSKDTFVELLDSWRRAREWPTDIEIGWIGRFDFSDRERALPLW